MDGKVIDFEGQMAKHAAAGHRLGLSGGGVDHPVPGAVTIYPPVARGGALLLHKARSPEWSADVGERCSKCRSGDVVIVVGFPGGDGEPLKFCRSCLNRPVGEPLVIQFRE